jgi:hypothetical protein
MSRARLNWGLVLSVLGLVVAWGTSSCRSYAAIEHRISVVETEQHDGDRRLERIEHKLDRLLERWP